MRLLKLLMAVLLTEAVVSPSLRDSCMDRPGIVYRIARMEGFYADSGIPRTHNNPGSLVYVGQRGAIRGSRGFAMFRSRELGLHALDVDLTKKKYQKPAMQRAWTWLK